jgi:hypothetical protein
MMVNNMMIASVSATEKIRLSIDFSEMFEIGNTS